MEYFYSDSVSVSGDKPRGKYNPSNSGSGKYSIQSTSTWKSSVRLTAGALDENGSFILKSHSYSYKS